MRLAVCKKRRFHLTKEWRGADVYKLVKIEQLVGGRRCIMKP